MIYFVRNILRYIVHIVINDNLKPYIVGYEDDYWGKNGVAKLKLADVVFDEITGITTYPESTDMKIVQYRVKIIPSEMSKLFPIEQNSNQKTEREAKFRKFDDGWRLAQ